MYFLLTGDSVDVFFDLFDLVDDLRCSWLECFCFAEEVFCCAELAFGHHNGAHLKVGSGFIFFIWQAFSDGLADVAFSLFEVIFLHGQHTHL